MICEREEYVYCTKITTLLHLVLSGKLAICCMLKTFLPLLRPVRKSRAAATYTQCFAAKPFGTEEWYDVMTTRPIITYYQYLVRGVYGVKYVCICSFR